MKINYIIATWNGIRVKPVCNVTYYEQALRNHIKILNNTLNSITQITIMKPKSNVVNSYYDDINLNDKIKIVDCENKYQSYGQWMKAANLFLNDFDYFIFIEDDYVPATDNFDMKLIQIYKEGTFLCSKVGGENDLKHCQISNGIISNNTIRNLISNIKYSEWFDTYSKKYPDLIFRGTNYQRAFSRYFIENEIFIEDYSIEYMVDYYANGYITDFTSINVKNKIKIFTPIQNVCK